MMCLLTIFILKWSQLFRPGELELALCLRRKSPATNAHPLLFYSFPYNSSHSQNAKVAHLTSQLLASSSASRRSDPDSDALDEEEELFAELEAEIENDDGPYREQGLKQLQRECGGLFTLLVTSI